MTIKRLFPLLGFIFLGAQAQEADSLWNYPLKPIPLPAKSDPLNTIIPKPPLDPYSPSVLKTPKNRLDAVHSVNYETRKVDIDYQYTNQRTKEAFSLWQAHYPELALYTYDLNQAALRSLWLNSFIGQDAGGAPSGDTDYDIEIPFTFPSWLKDFGLNKPKLEIDGDLTIQIAGSRTKKSNDELSQDRWLIGTPNPDLQANLHVKGKVGEHLSIEIKTNENLGRDDFKITYKENEEGEFENQILQEVEAGKTSLDLAGTELTGYSEVHKGLFGIKTKLKFGDIYLTTIASQEGGSQESFTLNSRSEDKEFEVLDKNFLAYKYYFLSIDDREALIDYYLDKTPISNPKKASKLKVYKVVSTGQDTLGYKSGITINHPNGGVYSSNATIKEMERFENFSEKGDYFFDELTGVIFIRSGQQNSIYGYSYDNTVSDQTGKIILFKDESNSDPELMPLMLRNHYNVQFDSDNASSFQLSMRTSETEVPGNYLSTIEVAEENGKLRTGRREIFDPDTRDLILPCVDINEKENVNYPVGISKSDFRRAVCLEPFRLLDPEAADIYETPQRSLNRVPSRFKFIGKSKKRNTLLKVSDTHSVSSGGCFDISPDTEKLKVGSTVLQKGVDYDVNYEFGQIELLSDRAKDPNQEISVTYECEPLFTIDNKTLLGARAEYAFENFGEGSHLGATALYKTQSTSENRPGLGREPFSSFLWGMNLRLTDNAYWMTSLMNSIPLIETKEESQWRFELEFARSYHNPNTQNSALLDDFEGSRRELPLPMRRGAWVKSSPPGGDDRSDASLYDPLLNYQHQGKFVWHSNFTRRFSEIYTPTGNSEIDRGEISILQFKIDVNDNRLGNSWGGIMRANSSYASDISQYNFLEVVVFGSEGQLYIDYGRVSEDISIGGREPNLSVDSEGDDQSKIVFNDHGLDNVTNDEEQRTEWSCRGEVCTPLIINAETSDDPALDDFKLQNGESDPTIAINGTQGNNVSTGSFDTEDLNGNGALDTDLDFVRYKIDLESSEYSEPLNRGWKRYRIPLSAFDEIISSKNSSLEEILRNNIYSRIFFTGVKGNATGRLEIAKVSVVGNQWEASERSTVYDSISQQDFQLIDNPPIDVDLTQESSAKDSNSIQVRVISNREDLQSYVQSPNTVIERESDSNTPLREQALVVQYDNLRPGQVVSATRFFDTEVKDLTMYENLKMEIHLDGIGENVPENVRFGFQIGNGNLTSSKNYYEWSFRPTSARCQEELSGEEFDDLSDTELKNRYAECHQSNWLANQFKIPIKDFWPLLKLDRALGQDSLWKVKSHPDSTYNLTFETSRELNDYLIDTRDSIASTSNNRSEAISIVGDPSLSRVNWIRFVVYVDEDMVADEKATGVFWINDMRLDGVRSGWGTAARSAMQLDFAKVMVLSGDVNYRDGEFATLNSTGSSPMPSLAEAKTQMDYQGNFQFSLNSFAPDEWKMKIPLSLATSNSIERPYLRPNSDISLTHDNFQDLGSDLINDRWERTPQQEISDRTESQPLSRGYQTLNTQHSLGIGYSKDYVADSTWYTEWASQILLERPSVNFNYRESKLRSPTSADSLYSYTTLLNYNLGNLNKKKGYFQWWPATWTLTLADFQFINNRRLERDPNVYVDPTTTTIDTLPVIVDYQLDLRHRTKLDWNMFPFLKFSYDLEIRRDLDAFKESFTSENLLSDNNGGYFGVDRVFDYDDTEYKYVISETPTGVDEDGEQTFNRSLKTTKTSAAREYLIFLKEKDRRQNFRMTFNPRLARILTFRTTFNNQFDQTHTYSDDFDPHDIDDIKNNYWTINRTSSFEVRPTLQISQLFGKGDWSKGIRDFLRKWNLRSINASWRAAVNTQGEDFTLWHLRNRAKVSGGDYYLYSLGLGNGDGFRNPWDIMTGDILKEGPMDHTGFAEYYNTHNNKVDSVVYRKQFLNSVTRAATVGTRMTLPWGRITTSYDLGWNMEFQQTREFPLQIDTTITWPKFTVGVNVPNFVNKVSWLKKSLSSLTLSSRFTYQKDTHSRPQQNSEDAIDYKYEFKPIIGVNIKTKKNLSITNNVDVAWSTGYHYLDKFNPEGDTIEYLHDDIKIDSITPWAYQSLQRGESFSIANRFSLRYPLQTNKGFRLWRWYIRLKEPINLGFQNEIGYKKDELFSFTGNPNDSSRIYVLRDGQEINGEQVNAEEPSIVKLDETYFQFTVTGDYQFSEKISANASIKYTNLIEWNQGTTDSEGSSSEDVVTQSLSYLMAMRFVF